MIVDFMCLECKKVQEEYFHNYEAMVSDFESKKITCNHCKSNRMRRMFGPSNILPSEIPGYWKGQTEHSIGSRFDYKQSWY